MVNKILVVLDVSEGDIDDEQRILAAQKMCGVAYKNEVINPAALDDDEELQPLNVFEQKEIANSYDICPKDFFLENPKLPEDYKVTICMDPLLYSEIANKPNLNYSDTCVAVPVKIGDRLVIGCESTEDLYQAVKEPGHARSRKVRAGSMRAFIGALQFYKGNVPVETKPGISMCVDLEGIDELLEAVKITGECAIDCETFPRTPGIPKDAYLGDSKSKSKKMRLLHNTRPNLLKIRIAQFSPQIGKAFIVPFYDPCSPFNVGKDTHIRVCQGKSAEDYIDMPYPVWSSVMTPPAFIGVKKDGEWVKTYDGDIINWRREMVLALIENQSYCAKNDIDNLLDVVFQKINDGITQKPDADIICHNVAMDVNALRSVGMKFCGSVFDTMEMHHTLDKISLRGLKAIVNKYWPEFWGYGEDMDFESSDIFTLALYGGLDAELTLRYYHYLGPKLLAEPDHYRYFRNSKAPGSSWFSDMELSGDYIDVDRMRKLIQDATDEKDSIEYEMRKTPVFQSYMTNKQEARKKESLEVLERLLKVTLQNELEKAQAKLDEAPKYSKRGNNILASWMKLNGKVQWLLNPNGPSEHYVSSVYKLQLEIKAVRLGKAENYYEWTNNKSGKRLGHRKYIKRKLGSPGAFNFSSSAKDIKDFIYFSPHGLQYEMPVITHTKKVRGKSISVTEPSPSVNKDELYWFPDPSGFIALYRRFTGISYIITSAKEVVALATEDGRICTNFGYTETDRSLSKTPNMQNFTQRSDIKENVPFIKEFLACFITPAGPQREVELQELVKPGAGVYPNKTKAVVEYYRYKCDLSMAELRWACEAYGIRSMAEKINAYDEDPANNPDLHEIASSKSVGIEPMELRKWKYDEEKKDEYGVTRTSGKADNFGFIFGQGAQGFQGFARTQYKIIYNLQEAKARRGHWFSLYPEIAQAHTNQRRLVAQQAYSRSLFGSRRNLPRARHHKKGIKNRALRQGINTKVQASSSIGMIQSGIIFYIRSKILGFKGKTVNLIHDDLPGYCSREEAKLYFQELIVACTDPLTKEYFDFEFQLTQLQADYEVGTNWANAGKATKDGGKNEEVENLTWEDYKPPKRFVLPEL